MAKALEKQTKAIKGQGEKQIKAIENRVEKQFLDTSKINHRSISKDFSTEEAMYESNKIKEIEQETNRDDLIYKIIVKKKNRKNDLQELKTIRSFWRETPNDELTLEDALEEDIKFKNEIDKLKESAKLKKTKQKRKKKDFLKRK